MRTATRKESYIQQLVTDVTRLYVYIQEKVAGPSLQEPNNTFRTTKEPVLEAKVIFKTTGRKMMHLVAGCGTILMVYMADH